MKENIVLYLSLMAGTGFLGLMLGGFLGHYFCKFFTIKEYEEQLKELEDKINEC